MASTGDTSSMATGHSATRPQRRSRAKDPADRKRAVYVEEACIFCKGRKIRCDGKLPCGPCQRRSFDCRYTKPVHGDAPSASDAPASVSGSPSSRTSDSARLSDLTDIVARLQKKIALLEQGDSVSDHGIVSTSPSRGQDVVDVEQPASAPGSSPVFAGPTSAEFSFGVANVILERESGQKSKLNPELAVAPSSRENEDSIPPAQAALPLHGLRLHDTLRLIQVYRETIGILYPIVEVDAMTRTATSVLSPEDPFGDRSTTLDVAQLKMILAIALLGEGGGSSPLAKSLHEDVKQVISDQTMALTFTLEGQALLLLTAFFHMNRDDSRLASRYVVIASRIMIESGLHLKQIRRRLFPHAAEHSRLLVVLTTCMYLDRQLNFNAGLPLTLKDADVDIPEEETMPAYLTAMTSYMRMGPRAWASVTDDRGRLKYRINSEDFEFVEFQVRRWQANLPEDLRMDGGSELAFADALDDGTRSLRFILYLRANQFKIVIMRPILFSSQTFKANLEHVRQIIHLATDNIATILTMNERYGLYEKRQPLLNLFLSSSLSTLFLICVHLISDPRPELGRDVQGGIDRGLELLRLYSYCRSSQRLSDKFATLLQRLGFPKVARSRVANVPPPRHTDSSPDVAGDTVMVGADSSSTSASTSSFEFSSWNWSNFLPGGSPAEVSNDAFQFTASNNQGFPSFSYPELNPIPMIPYGTGQFNDDLLLNFITNFS